MAQHVVSGTVKDPQGEPILGATILVKGTTLGTSTDLDGFFKIEIPEGIQTLVFSGIGFTGQQFVVDPTTASKPINVQLKNSLTQLDDVQIVGESKSTRIEKKGFHVTAIETQQIKSQSVAINTVLARSPGVRVRTTGGVGSDFQYSLDGMSGNAIRFFIDGIPMDYYGSSYSINNLPIALVERIDIYKGVVPIELGSDALGGVINLVTDQNISNFVEASYSFGSFNTHRTAIHGQWRSKSGFTAKLSTFYTYSDNNYKVWGRNVFYGEEGTGRIIEFTKDNPAERFNDDFQTVSAKVDIGFTKKKWADQFFISLLVTDQKKGVQTGQTMGHVYGEMRNNEKVIMPSIAYRKNDFIAKGLNVNVFAGYSDIEGVLIDTTTVRYDWRGEEIGTNPLGGERGRGSRRSIYTLNDESYISRLNTTLRLPLNLKLGFNLLYSSTKRTGNDPFAEDYEIPFLLPQKIASHSAGLSLESIAFENKLLANVFLKKYGFTSSINELIYTSEYETFVRENNVSNWGGGFAASYRVFPKLLLKSSAEQATRMPTATEALGDGVTLQSNPDILPEQSFNANLGITLGRFEFGYDHGLQIALSGFYRKVTDQLQLLVSGGQETGEYINIRALGGPGVELELIYDYGQNFKVNLNGTYLDLRNRQRIDEDGNDNILFGDRLRNQPYLMANAGLEYSLRDFVQKESKLFAYFQSSYVHEFFLRWPSLGNEDTKDNIPTQLVFDAGIGYTFPSQKLSLALDFSNMLNEQIYDNFLLQKPGRAIFFKINYKITQ
ncbi:MAG: TonB-dependent receptor [Flavobacteriaceae bacterium]